MEGNRLHRHWMRQALNEAQKALALGEIPVGAVVVQGERLLAAAHNERETTGDPTAHAEILALRRAGVKAGDWRLSSATLYVTLEPCAMCAAACVHARLQRLVFGAGDARRGGAGSMLHLPYLLREDGEVDVIGGVDEAECKALMDLFFARRREFRRGV